MKAETLPVTLEEFSMTRQSVAGEAVQGPTAGDVAMLLAQYRKAVDGLYEAYRFGVMLLAVKRALEGETPWEGQGAAHPLHPAEAQGASPRFSSSATRGTAREVTIGKNGNALTGSGWNAGTGLKAWLAEHCPEINYSTARRFLAVAEKTHAALAAGDPAAPGAWGEAPCASAGAEGAAQAPSESAVRAYLEGKSQRQVLTKAPAVPVKRRATTPEELSEKVYETMDGFLGRLEGMERSYETNLLSQDSRRELVTRLKGLARRLEEAGR